MREIKLGEISVRPVLTSRFRLDGGTMFGIIPRALWERKAPPDERNRILLNVNSFLVESAGKRILLEAGMGSKYDERRADILGLEEREARAALEDCGVSPGEIDFVILTHLHFDHAGGSTCLEDGGAVSPAFPRARYVIQRKEWDSALNPHPLARGSYIGSDFEPLEEAGLLCLVDGAEEVAPGVTVEPAPGHTRGHQVVRIRSGDGEACYLGDLVPTAAHLRLNWLMSWDLEPQRVYSEKARVLEDAASRGILLLWSHDSLVSAGRVEERSPGEYRILEGSTVRADSD